MGEPDHLRRVVALLVGPDGSSEVLELVLHLETHGHLALFFLRGDLDENSHLVGFSEGNDAARQSTEEHWVSQAPKALFQVEQCSQRNSNHTEDKQEGELLKEPVFKGDDPHRTLTQGHPGNPEALPAHHILLQHLCQPE